VDFVSEKLGRNVVSAVLAAGPETHGEPWSSSADEEDGVSAAIRAAYLATDNELLAQHQVRAAYCARVSLSSVSTFVLFTGSTTTHMH
jgi:protein phosphatase 1L